MKSARQITEEWAREAPGTPAEVERDLWVGVADVLRTHLEARREAGRLEELARSLSPAAWALALILQGEPAQVEEIQVGGRVVADRALDELVEAGLVEKFLAADDGEMPVAMVRLVDGATLPVAEE